MNCFTLAGQNKPDISNFKRPVNTIYNSLLYNIVPMSKFWDNNYCARIIVTLLSTVPFCSTNILNKMKILAWEYSHLLTDDQNKVRVENTKIVA